jgi:hypothetical protein
MTFQDLLDFLEHKMSMSHVYQPLLVRALVDAGGAATLRQLAQVFSRRTRANSCTTKTNQGDAAQSSYAAWGRFCKWPTRLLEHGRHDTGAKGTRQNVV